MTRAALCSIVALLLFGGVEVAVARTAAPLVFCAADASYRETCGGAVAKPAKEPRQASRAVVSDENTKIVGSRPAACPHRYCGCEASLYVFGEIRKELNLAANWKRKFPRTEPASGMVAAREGHVMVLMSHVSGDEWMVHDGNSGGGRTREHVRSIRGYTIVNPHATVTAQN